MLIAPLPILLLSYRNGVDFSYQIFPQYEPYLLIQVFRVFDEVGGICDIDVKGPVDEHLIRCESYGYNKYKDGAVIKRFIHTKNVY